MSTIVAVRKGPFACIAADSLTSFGGMRQYAKYDRSWEKIHHFGDNYLGVVGSAAHHYVIHSLFTQELTDFDLSSREAIFETFRRAHPLLKDKYFLNPKDQEDDPYESSQIDALLVNPHGVFGIYSLREVYEYNRFWAIGSGEAYALGGLFALYDSDQDVEALARAGIEAGAEFDNASELPMSHYTVRLVEPDPH